MDNFEDNTDPHMYPFDEEPTPVRVSPILMVGLPENIDHKLLSKEYTDGYKEGIIVGYNAAVNVLKNLLGVLETICPEDESIEYLKREFNIAG